MIKRLNQLLLVIVCIVQVGCGNLKQSDKKADIQEFEGVITYHEIFKRTDGKIDVDDTVQQFYSHGNFVNIHSNGLNESHFLKGIYLAKDYYLENMSLRLLLFSNSDTLHQLNLSMNGEKLDSFKLKKVNEKILSRDCEKVELNISHADKDSTTYTNASFIFSPGYLKVDNQHFKNWKLGYFNKVIERTGTLYLKFKTVYYDSSHKRVISFKTLDVISVKEKPIDQEVFKIDPSRINWVK